MANFTFLTTQPQYSLFAAAAMEAERVYYTSPAMSAVGSRKALELAVKWVYSADTTMQMPYKDNLQALIHEPSFRFSVDHKTWGKLPGMIKVGNLAVHTGQQVTPPEALLSLRSLFDFIQWIDYCYGNEYEPRHFDEKLIPRLRAKVDVKKIKEQESLLGEKDAEIEALRKQIEQLSAQYTASKEEHQQERTFEPEDMSEFDTRKLYIDVDLKLMGWHFDDTEVRTEYPVDDMENISGKKGFIDYVLFGKDGLPLAIIEAKRTTKDANAGKKQAMLYADCLERKFGRRPFMFTSNGFETYFWDDMSGPQRQVSGLFGRGDLEKLMNRRSERKILQEIPIDDRITDRYYQKEAIRAVADAITENFRKFLLVMATGTGKTRTASSLTDVLSRGGYVTNVLFLADRTALVKQAKEDFKKYLPDISLCNLCENKDDRSARIVFSTYPTMLNAIDDCKNENGQKLFTPAHFDLVIIDESHRSIFKKYRAIFGYFDAMLLGLTATPKTDVDRNTYDFFEMENGVPTYAYDYETAVRQDHVLVPYYNYEVKTKFLHEGIRYDELSEEDKVRYEEDFAEDDTIPDFIPSSKLNKFIFNETTVDMVIQDLMERGIKVGGGDRLGKTIIFAQNKRHADFIVKRIDKLYPQYNGKLAQRVLCDDAYAQTVIDDFKVKEYPRIVVSVDMMDTGIDVPECLNLVFFKQVMSKTKFWQMIGRGTRLCPDLSCVDQVEGEYDGKKRFLIFDYCGNFAFFREKPNGYETKDVQSLTESIFIRKIRIVEALQDKAFSEDRYQQWRNLLVDESHGQVTALNTELVSVRLKLQYVEKYRKKEAFQFIGDTEKGELTAHIAPLVYMNEPDDYAKAFDNFMYGLILAGLEGKPSFKRAKSQLCLTAELLEKKSNIPQVGTRLPMIKKIGTDAYWDAGDILLFEETRRELRELIRFLADMGGKKKPIITRLTDPVIDMQEGSALDPAYDFEDYRKKVNRYVEEHGDTMAIYKLKRNIPLSTGDYQELERVFTEELGSKEDYAREYGETPFGLLIRRIVKLDHDAAMEAFSQFINDESLNQRQIVYVRKIINHIEQNGYMDNVNDLMKPPFDKPVSFVKLFDAKKRSQIIEAINGVRENAVNVVA